jgi:Zn-finger nucleic acid-binding protein
MGVDEAKCPHCGTWLSYGDIEKLEDNTISAMGTGKLMSGDDLYVCPACETILG